MVGRDLHRFARDNNIFILLVNYLPSGRSASGHTNALSRAEQFDVFARLAAIDREEYGISQRGIFSYAGSQPCLIRGTGLYVKVNGDVLACPGETRAIGNIADRSLSALWADLADVRRAFDGLCPPREISGKRLPKRSPRQASEVLSDAYETAFRPLSFGSLTSPLRSMCPQAALLRCSPDFLKPTCTTCRSSISCTTSTDGNMSAS